MFVSDFLRTRTYKFVCLRENFWPQFSFAISFRIVILILGIIIYQWSEKKKDDTFFILLYLSDLHHITGMIIANFHWEARRRKTNHEAMFRGKVDEPLEAEVATAAYLWLFRRTITPLTAISSVMELMNDSRSGDNWVRTGIRPLRLGSTCPPRFWFGVAEDVADKRMISKNKCCSIVASHGRVK